MEYTLTDEFFSLNVLPGLVPEFGELPLKITIQKVSNQVRGQLQYEATPYNAPVFPGGAGIYYEKSITVRVQAKKPGQMTYPLINVSWKFDELPPSPGGWPLIIGSDLIGIPADLTHIAGHYHQLQGNHEARLVRGFDIDYSRLEERVPAENPSEPY